QKNGRIYDYFRNRFMFPIIDLRGNVIGFGGRVMDDSTPKYLNSPENVIFNKRKNLFGLNVAKKTKFPHIILTEGYMDTIALHQFGFDCAVASLGTSLTEEHALLLSKYTKQVFLSYDSDEAGQRATKRAIDILEKTGVQVKVLRMQGAKDPDEYLQKFGADRFKLLLEQSENHVEYRLLTLKNQFDLEEDDQRVEFLKQAAKLIASLKNAVEREIYGARAAEAAKISVQAMAVEVDKAFKQRKRQDAKKQEKQDLDVAKQHQPQSRNIRYDNLRSATAEEGIIAMIFLEPHLLKQCQNLSPDHFSVELLGRIFGLLQSRYGEGMHIALPLLGQDLSGEEMSHLTSIVQQHDTLVSETVFADYLHMVEEERSKTQVVQPADLLAMRDRYQKKKAYGGNGI
ncbi:MAG: toprim domain-containing protein, partial [Eubacteriales bacterium]